MMRKSFSVAFATFAFIALVATATKAQEWDNAISLYNQKQYRQAAKAFHAVLKSNPDAWQSWYYIGTSHYNLQSYLDSIDAFNNYMKGAEKAKNEKEQGVAYYYIGFSNYQLKQYDKTIPALTKYIAITEKLKGKLEPNARAALGRAYVFSDKFNEAIPVLTQSVAELKNATNFYYLGYSHQRLGHTDQAIAALNQGLTVDPKDVDTLSLLGSLYLSQSSKNPQALKQVIATGEKLVAVKDDERAWSLLGQGYLLDKQYAKAAPFLDKYARAHTDSSGAWLNLGLAYSRSSQWKPAAEALEQASKLDAKNVPVLLELGYVYESDKLPEKALNAYERAYAASGQTDATARDSIERLKAGNQPPAIGNQSVTKPAANTQPTTNKPQPPRKKPVGMKR